MLFSAFKAVGGAYLIWMGLRLWRRPSAERAVADQSIGGHSARHAFRDSLVVEVLNPKSALFYVAFLPQFTSSDAAWPVFVQLLVLVLGTVANIAFSLSDILCILLARKMAARARASDKLSVFGHRVGGTILFGLGGKPIADAR